MRMKLVLFWLLALAAAAPVAAQTPPTEAAEEQGAETPAPGGTQTQPAEEAEEEEEALPDIDIWSEDAADEDDVFIPTERISADSNIAYPADI